MKELKGSVYAVISAIIFGCMPIVAKYLYAEGCNPVSLVVYRYSLALPVLLILALREQGKDERERKAAGEPSKRDYDVPPPPVYYTEHRIFTDPDPAVFLL